MSTANASEQFGPVQDQSIDWVTERWRYHVIVLAATTAVVAAAMLMEVEGRRQVVLPGLGAIPGICAWQRMFAMNCPGCGLTRCFVSLADGDVARGWSYNPVGLFLFAILLYQLPYRLLQLWRLRRGAVDHRHSGWTIQVLVWLVVGGLFGQWLLRDVL